jgi:hypothetical protein
MSHTNIADVLYAALGLPRGSVTFWLQNLHIFFVPTFFSIPRKETGSRTPPFFLEEERREEEGTGRRGSM